MKYYIASDHAGFRVKEKLKKFLKKRHIAFEDLGTNSKESVDYPEYAKKLAQTVRKTNSRGILICGTGTGMSIAANRIKGIRAVAAYDKYTAIMGRKDNDANVLCLRGRKFSFRKAKGIFKLFHKTRFSGIIRHKRRIRKIDQ